RHRLRLAHHNRLRLGLLPVDRALGLRGGRNQVGRGSVHHQVHHPEDQALEDLNLVREGGHHRVDLEGLDLTKDLWVGQVSAHNQVLTMEGLGSSQGQQEDPRKGLLLAREEGRHKGGLGDLDLNSHPTKDLWVDRLHRVGQADRPLEGLAHLNGQNKTSRLSWGSLFMVPYVLQDNFTNNGG
ncbi:hypothetical protein, partial [Acidithiobacillus albertensis]|uniref:hypothetical protein n=1 Tax=Acidithiobacillus albertensis TaxID=119978 RepID=UPI000B01B73A